MAVNIIKPEANLSLNAAELYRNFLRGELQLLGLKSETERKSMQFSIEHFLHDIPKPRIYATVSIGNNGKLITRVFKGSQYLKGLFFFLSNKTRIRDCKTNPDLDNLRNLDIPELKFLWRQSFDIYQYKLEKKNRKALHIISILNPDGVGDFEKVLDEK